MSILLFIRNKIYILHQKYRVMEVISRSYYAEKLRSANHEGITHLHLRRFLSQGFAE